MDTELLIQKYFKNELNSKEQVLFDDLLQNNNDFKNEFTSFKDLKLAIATEERYILKKELQALNTVKKTTRFSKMMIAASFALLVSLGSYFMFKEHSITNQELFAQNFKPYRNVVHPVVRGEENLTKIEKAFMYYENGNYTEFIKIIKTTNYTNKDYNFYIANAYLANKNTKEAKLILENYLKNDKVKFFTKANWYLGLIYLKLDETKKAKTIFELVEKRGDFNTKKAIELLKKLN